MWLLALILVIKLQMPTWFWIIFTIITVFRLLVWIISKHLENEIEKSITELSNTK